MEKMENGDHVRDATKRMPRGYAYMRFRNDGFTFEVKFPHEIHVENIGFPWSRVSKKSKD